MKVRNPWLSMWFYPRQTIRNIISVNPKKRLWALSWLYGMSAVLYFFQIYGVGVKMDMWFIWLGAFVLGPFWGYATFAVQSWLIQQTGKLFKAKSDFQAIRAATAWSCVPFWINLFVWGFLCLYFGHTLFLYFPGSVQLIPQDITVLMVALAVKLAAGIWSLVIYVRALAEVQKYSIGMAILNLLFMIAILFLATFLLQVFWMNL